MRHVWTSSMLLALLVSPLLRPQTFPHIRGGSMRHKLTVLTLMTVLLLMPAAVFAQDSTVSVPRVINITGVFRPADGQRQGDAEELGQQANGPTGQQ